MPPSAILAFDPTDCISGRLMRLERIVAKRYRRHLAEYGLTNSQMSMMFMLSHAGPMKRSELARAMALERSSVTRNLDRLVTTGVVHVSVSGKVFVTSQGSALLERIMPAWTSAMREVDDLLGEDGRSALALLDKALGTAEGHR